MMMMMMIIIAKITGSSRYHNLRKVILSSVVLQYKNQHTIFTLT